MQLPFRHGEDEHSSISEDFDEENIIHLMLFSYDY